MLLSIHPVNPEPRKITDVVERLNAGAVIVCPTDTVYAFACSAHQPRAIEAIARLKGTKTEKTNLSLICKDLGQLSLYARAIDTPSFRVMKKALPGPYTFIVPASSQIPNLFKNKKHTVGIRVPAHPIPVALVEALGHALVVTSVHDDDEILEHTTDPEVIHERIGKQVELVIDGGIGGMQGSTVIDITGSSPTVLREGKGPVEGLL